MRSLHVAALPFPSPQGTQGLLHSMLSALAAAGHDAHLACYAHGVTPSLSTPYTLQRLSRGLGARSLRSGPSGSKLLLDALLVGHVRSLVRRLRPELVVAHHVEAALACTLARVPFVFVAHTSLRHELSAYFPVWLAPGLAYAGALLDRHLCARAQHVLAVAPALAAHLRSDGVRQAEALPVPWPVPPAADAAERESARAQLSFRADERVLLYAGNLDAYQGLPLVARAVAQLGPGWRWLIATASDTASRPELMGSGLPLRIAPLGNERDRRLVHAAADVVAVPRASLGGLPIKLLDALARGARVVATGRASAGLSLEAVCRVVPDDDPAAFAAACRTQAAHVGPIFSEAARDYVRTAHAPERFVTHLAALAHALSARPEQEPF